MRPSRFLLILAAAAIGACAAGTQEPASGLWPLVQRCIAQQQATGDPAPCLKVDTAEGYAILKDLRGATQFLLVATDRRWGIEDPRIEAADAPDYFAAAWSARRCVAAAAGAPIPDGDLSLAINSTAGRSDGQFHIHIDRLRPEVARALDRDRSGLVQEGHVYRVRHIDGLAGANLFAALEKATAGPIGDWTIVVAGDPRGGFFVLTDRVHGRDVASGEELQVDHPLLPKAELAVIEASAAGCAGPPAR